MSPRLTRRPAAHHHESHTGTHIGELSSHDRDRQLEDALHHPEDHSHPHKPHYPSSFMIRGLSPQHTHHPQHRPVLPPRHDTHSHPHGEDLPTHTNKPGPIKPTKRMTRTGTRK
ncbi:MAG TPA: hypothetical protein VEI81_07690 [Methanoregula sp.]|nr:hypothetical protein [Methanoregula sp.]